MNAVYQPLRVSKNPSTKNMVLIVAFDVSDSGWGDTDAIQPSVLNATDNFTLSHFWNKDTGRRWE